MSISKTALLSAAAIAAALGAVLPAPPAHAASIIIATQAIWVARTGSRDGIETESTLRAVQHACDSKPKCDGEATNAWFAANTQGYADPAVGHQKQLTVEWTCQPGGDHRHGPIVEGERFQMSC